ncbi:Chorion peroxidase [Hypsibius exemplaris]|uniref:Chorion peroxidase n=1 Tax=Hypsibius exemplaris TaxID=2072580 RepID=A0A1W0XDK1_HYPEX|nr:Chorion peroxidase [Hypsibius exemplaris]
MRGIRSTNLRALLLSVFCFSCGASAQFVDDVGLATNNSTTSSSPKAKPLPLTSSQPTGIIEETVDGAFTQAATSDKANDLRKNRTAMKTHKQRKSARGAVTVTSTTESTTVLAHAVEASPKPKTNASSLVVNLTAKLVQQKCKSVSNGEPKVPLKNPFDGELPICAQTKYRTFDGTCNNIAFPDAGATDSVLTRMLKPDYADSMSAPRIAKGIDPLPSPRIVSKHVGGNADVPSTTVTHMFMQFGQFIDHDITNTARMTGVDGATPTCCVTGNATLDPACFPISVPNDDPLSVVLSQTCIEFIRSLPGSGLGCNDTTREQVNQNTAFIDGSAIYGLSNETASDFRASKQGQLKSFKLKESPHGSLLPRSPNNPECVKPTTSLMCFAAGDNRVDTHLGIAGMQTLWLREHNRIAKALHRLNPKWTNDQLFDEARHITIAELQYITYNEFLPVLLGNDLMERFDLQPLKTGLSKAYNIALHPGILNEFATAAYRVGHSMVPSSFRLASNEYVAKGSVSLRSTYFRPFTLYEKDGFDEIIFGMLSSPAQETDNNFIDDLSDHLFEAPDDTFRLDLTAINVQRGRDHGLQGWMKWRELCGLPTFDDFDSLRALDVLPLEVVNEMEMHYRFVADIDLYMGGTSERHVDGGAVGPTFACIIAEQFRRLKMGDRFWFENDLPLPSAMSEEQVNDIRKTSMSRILCDNTPLMETVQTRAFEMPNSKTNPLVACKSLTAPTLKSSMIPE